MARPAKVGLDYFELDCHIGEKVKLIQAEYGYKAFAIVVKLYQKIYGELGYYCEWNKDSLLLFMSENGVSSCKEKNYIKEVVAACIKRGIFSEKIYNKYGVLTSVRVQETYLNATSRRESVKLKKEYLLIDVGKENKNVVINEVNVDRNEIKERKNSQSREEKSKEYLKNTMCKADALVLFEELWKLYPSKKGKGQVSLAAKKRLLEIGRDEMIRAIERYKAEYEKDSDWRKLQNGSTFFNSGYVDYLDENFVPSQKNKVNAKKNSFNDFSQRDYDYGELKELESQLLRRKI